MIVSMLPARVCPVMYILGLKLQQRNLSSFHRASLLGTKPQKLKHSSLSSGLSTGWKVVFGENMARTVVVTVLSRPQAPARRAMMRCPWSAGCRMRGCSGDVFLRCFNFCESELCPQQKGVLQPEYEGSTHVPPARVVL
jgi:hypothetical protein